VASFSDVPPRKTIVLPHGKRNVFGPVLKNLRQRKGLTISRVALQAQISKEWDLDETSLGHIEAGRRTITDAELLFLLQIYEARLSDLEG